MVSYSERGAAADTTTHTAELYEVSGHRALKVGDRDDGGERRGFKLERREVITGTERHWNTYLLLIERDIYGSEWALRSA